MLPYQAINVIDQLGVCSFNKALLNSQTQPVRNKSVEPYLGTEVSRGRDATLPQIAYVLDVRIYSFSPIQFRKSQCLAALGFVVVADLSGRFG